MSEFKDYIKEIERLNTVKVPTATAASKTAKRRKNKRATGSPTLSNVGKREMLGAFAPTQHPFPSCRRRNAFDGGRYSSDDSSEENRNDEGRFSRWRFALGNYR
ncbi:hypothetical protein TNCV_435341 [Trichonephila clavipes]|nr:hypothetical protein TNCV_435341 [Trichonephila clavipes]